jgi:hypothetical protein
MSIAALLLLLASASPAVTPLPVTSRQLAYEHDGHTVHAVRWRDRLGDHTLLLDESGEYPSKQPNPDSSDPARDASVYAYEYLDAAGKATRVWKLEDHERGCVFDLEADFVPGSVTITDLDADGVAEVTFQYTLQCTSDVSPATRKLILREGKDKYAIRGTNRSPHFDPAYVTRKPDPAFDKAPPAFLKHAWEQWDAFVEVGAPQ